MVIQVTQEIIDIAEENKFNCGRFSPVNCLGAVIFKGLFPDRKILFGLNDVIIDGEKYIVSPVLEWEVRNYINDRPVEPFEFEFELRS